MVDVAIVINIHNMDDYTNATTTTTTTTTANATTNNHRWKAHEVRSFVALLFCIRSHIASDLECLKVNKEASKVADSKDTV